MAFGKVDSRRLVQRQLAEGQLWFQLRQRFTGYYAVVIEFDSHRTQHEPDGFPPPVEATVLWEAPYAPSGLMERWVIMSPSSR